VKRLALTCLAAALLLVALLVLPRGGVEAQSRPQRSGGDGPNPLAVVGGGEGPKPIFMIFGGSEGPKPMNIIIVGGDGPKPFSVYGGDGPHPLHCPPGTVVYLPGAQRASAGFKPEGLPPEAGPPVKELLSEVKKTGRVSFKGSRNHKVFVRVRANLDGAHRKCTLTLFDKPTLPPVFTPYLDLYGVTAPTQWFPLPEQTKDKYYFFDGLKMTLHGEWELVPKTHVTKWELGNGYYYRFGFIDPGIGQHPIFPPGDLVIEAVAVYYYRREVKGKATWAEPFEVPEEEPKVPEKKADK
jgi:hypothetical protein